MASNFLNSKLSQAAQLSPAFNNLPLSQQAEIISSLASASDAQVLEAISAFEQDLNNSQQSDQRKTEKLQQLAEQAISLEKEIKSATVEISKVKNEDEQEKNMQEISGLENQISELNKPAPKPKRKKFLGIF